MVNLFSFKSYFSKIITHSGSSTSRHCIEGFFGNVWPGVTGVLAGFICNSMM